MVKTLFLGIVLSLSLSGCLGISPQEKKATFIQNATDRQLAEKFATFYDSDRYSIRTTSTIARISGRFVEYDDGVDNKSANYFIKTRLVKNTLFDFYKQFILDRGNSYKIYASGFNSRLQSARGIGNLLSFDKTTSRYLYWNLIPVIAEYDKSGNLVSIMLNMVEKGVMFNNFNDPNAPVTIFLTADLLFGSELNPINFAIPKKEWEANLIKTSADE